MRAAVSAVAGSLGTGRVLLGACLVACLGLPGIVPPPATAEPALPGGFQDTVVFAGLEQPTTFRFSPDGRVFVAEKAGRIKVYDDLKDPTPEVFADLRTQVYNKGDRGLLGLALDPEFPGEPYVYALYTYDHILGEAGKAPRWGSPGVTGDPCPEPKGANACLVSGRLVRLTAEGNKAVEEEGAPLEETLVEDWCQQFSSHSVGDLEFGPDGALYASGGEGASYTSADYGQFGTPANPCGDPPGTVGEALSPPSAEGGSLRSQNLHNLSGKIIRIDPGSGEGLPDNPMAASLDLDTRRIVGFGFRNPFRFAIDPATGELYAGNVGSSEFEEIDHFAGPPGQAYNSGWPCYEGLERQFLFDDLGLAVCDSLYEAEPDSTSPSFFNYSHRQAVALGDECPFSNGSALSGFAFYEGSSFPSTYEGALFFADSVRGCIWAMRSGEDGKPDPLTTSVFLRGDGDHYPGVDLQEGPDGALYYVTLFGNEEFGPGAIHRISYEPGAPTARLTADPQWGEDLPLEVNLDASESSDPDEEPLEYEWDLDDDGTFETDGMAIRAEEFSNDENQVVSVRVTDAEDLSSTARVTIYPGDSPPELDIDDPEGDFTWGVGDEVYFEGSALDSDGNFLFGPSLYWSTRLAHCPSGPGGCHTHPLGVFAGVSDGTFLAPEHDYPSYIEITLNAVDWRGLSASETVRIDPRTVALSIGSDPPGISLTAGLVQAATPFMLPTIAGSNVLLSAPQTAQLDGSTYTWTGWSDGGARVHTVVAASSAGYTAIYAGPPGAARPTEPPSLRPPPESRPETTIRSHPPKKTRGRTASFSFSSSPKGNRFVCRLDAGRFRPCHSPRVYRKLKPGSHVFRVAAVGADGGADPSPATFKWKVLR